MSAVAASAAADGWKPVQRSFYTFAFCFSHAVLGLFRKVLGRPECAAFRRLHFPQDMKLRLLAACLASFVLFGCANVTTGSLQSPLEDYPSDVCILENPRVKINTALPSMEKAFERRGIKAVVCRDADECRSPWRVDYVMRRSWDFTTYLGTAEITLRKDGRLISKAQYKAGNFALTKWGRTDERIDGVVGKLLGE